MPYWYEVITDAPSDSSGGAAAAPEVQGVYRVSEALSAALAARTARYSATGSGTPFSSALPTGSKATSGSSTASTAASLANTSPGPAFDAIRAATFTVRPK